ncbi:MAG: hypothetical protein EZS28_033587 [Streblomastix strix]|uniref:Tail fiber protein n=1 Tax=Streblomastix strix TaxID=222440 RepID=A0A5J4UJF6_9EUKA|nr:MAG: hypothetical protein EZS28_033587 [Streblomastix strix]
MGFFSKIANFGSKILGGVKHAAQWIAPTLHKVLNTVAGPVGMIHPGIGAALGAGSNLAGAVDRLKRGSGSGSGQIQNEDYQLFIDNDNALVYAANNQIIDGQASDFALKIAADVNQLQSTVGTIDSDIVGVKNDIITIQQELARQQHFRGYYLLNTDIQTLPDSADGDFAFSAESGTVWMYDTASESSTWYNSGQVVPDQVTPASDAVPLVDGGAGVAGISTEYARGDHQHPLQINDQITPSADSTGTAGTSTAYARADHSHILNVSTTNPVADGTASVGTSAAYARSDHKHPLNVEPNSANVPLVNATAAAMGTSQYYSRNDHVHPQQLTYDGNITATKFIKTGRTNQQILMADGTNKQITDFNTSVAPRAYQIDPADGIYWLCFAVLTIPNYTSNGSYGCTMDINTTYVNDLFYQIKWNLRIQNGYNRRFEATQFGQVQTDFMICADTPETSLILRFNMKVFTNRGIIIGKAQINPTTTNNSQGLRISRNGCDYGQNPLGLTIALTGQENTANRGLRISADGNTLSFNGSVIAGVGATNGATNGTGTEGGFYSNGTNICWRVRPITLGSVPP